MCAWFRITEMILIQSIFHRMSSVTARTRPMDARHLQLARATIKELHRKNSALEDKLARKEELARMKKEFDDERHRMLAEDVGIGNLIFSFFKAFVRFMLLLGAFVISTTRTRQQVTARFQEILGG